jgi:hypothetical protein
VSAWAIGACGVLYLLSAVDFLRKNDWAMALVFAAYALANVGLIVVALRR